MLMDNTQRTEGMGNWKFTVYNPGESVDLSKTFTGTLKMDAKVYTVVESDIDVNGFEHVKRTLIVVPAQNVAFVENVA